MGTDWPWGTARRLTPSPTSVPDATMGFSVAMAVGETSQQTERRRKEWVETDSRNGMTECVDEGRLQGGVCRKSGSQAPRTGALSSWLVIGRVKTQKTPGGSKKVGELKKVKRSRAKRESASFS